MAHKRWIHEDISKDEALTRLGVEHGDFPVLLYILLVVHADDQGIVSGSPQSILWNVMPGRHDKTPQDIEDALCAIESIKQLTHTSSGFIEEPLLVWDRGRKEILFPIRNFYKYQNYIETTKRRGYTPSAKALPTHRIESTLTSDEERATTIEQVLELLPTRASPNARTIVSEAIARYPYVPPSIVVQCMRIVLDKRNKQEFKNKTDWASYFANQLEWKAKEYEPSNEGPTSSLDDIVTQRTRLAQEARKRIDSGRST